MRLPYDSRYFISRNKSVLQCEKTWRDKREICVEEISEYVCTNRRIKFASVSLYANVKISRRFPTEEAHVTAESQECRNTSFMNYDYVEGVTYIF